MREGEKKEQGATPWRQDVAVGCGRDRCVQSVRALLHSLETSGGFVRRLTACVFTIHAFRERTFSVLFDDVTV